MSSAPNPDPWPIPATPQRVTVTPEMAAHWLEHRNTLDNRRLSHHIATKYARTMAAGRWRYTHQGVAFDTLGWLIDGQHRLRAVALSGVAVDMFVVPGCDPGTFAVLDNGLKRQAGHLIKGPDAKTVASAVRILTVVTGTAAPGTRAHGGVYDGSMDTDLALEAVAAWPELSDHVLPVSNCYRYTRINKPMHLAILAQASRASHADRIPAWLEGLTHGANLVKGDPRLHLRNRFISDSRVLNGASMRSTTYNLIAKAWNAHAGSRSIGVLKVGSDEGTIKIL